MTEQLMSKRNRLLLSLALLAGVGVGFSLLWITAPRDQITAENFAKLKNGMTQEEVQDVLGGSPDPRIFLDGGNGSEILREGDVWTGKQFHIYVLFDTQGKAAGLLLMRPLSNESLLDKLHRWLRLPWW